MRVERERRGTISGVSSVSDELSPAGWPRPWLLWTPPVEGVGSRSLPRILPVPWINGVHPFHGDWVTFDEDRAVQAHEKRLCGVCGQPLDRIALLGRAGGQSTIGPGCHPRCLQLALTACPHFTAPANESDGDSAVAWRVDGPRPDHLPVADRRKAYESRQQVLDGLPALTNRDVHALATIDPWGTGRPDTMDADDTVSDQ